MRKKRSIVLNLALMVIITIFLSSGLAYVAALRLENQLFSDEKTSQMKAVAQVISIALKNALAAREAESISRVVNDVTQDEQEIVHLAVFGRDGEAVFDNGFDDETKRLMFESIKRNADMPGATAVLTDFAIGGEVFTLVFSKVVVRIGEREEQEHVSGYVALTFRRRPALEVERTKQVIILGTAVARTTRSMIENYIFSEAKMVLKELEINNPDVAFCYIIAPDNTILIHSDEALEGKELTDARTLRAQEVNRNRPIIMQEYSDKKRGKLIDISFLIESDGNKLGVLRIGYSMERLHRRIARLRLALAGLVLLFVGVSTGVSVVISRRFAKPILYLAESARRVGAGDLETLVDVKTGGRELQALAASFNDMVKGLRERNMIKDTFSRYVSKQVAEELLKNPEKISLGGEHKEVTILFSDIRGFTTLSEKLPAELVVLILNEYFNAMVDAVFEQEGTLDKYIGDALMAIYGSPTAHEDDPLRAIKTAISMREKLEELNEKWMNKDGLQPVKIGIGINTGKVIAGNIGHIQRMEFTVIGDNVNLASRIESLTKDYECPIIISEATYEKVKEWVEVNRLETVTVKGKTKPIGIYELLKLKA